MDGARLLTSPASRNAAGGRRRCPSGTFLAPAGGWRRMHRSPVDRAREASGAAEVSPESSPATPGGRAWRFFSDRPRGAHAHLLGAEGRRPSWDHVVGVVGALYAFLGAGRVRAKPAVLSFLIQRQNATRRKRLIELRNFSGIIDHYSDACKFSRRVEACTLLSALTQPLTASQPSALRRKSLLLPAAHSYAGAQRCCATSPHSEDVAHAVTWPTTRSRGNDGSPRATPCSASAAASLYYSAPPL